MPQFLYWCPSGTLVFCQIVVSKAHSSAVAQSTSFLVLLCLLQQLSCLGAVGTQGYLVSELGFNGEGLCAAYYTFDLSLRALMPLVATSREVLFFDAFLPWIAIRTLYAIRAT